MANVSLSLLSMLLSALCSLLLLLPWLLLVSTRSSIAILAPGNPGVRALLLCFSAVLLKSVCVVPSRSYWDSIRLYETRRDYPAASRSHPATGSSGEHVRMYCPSSCAPRAR